MIMDYNNTDINNENKPICFLTRMQFKSPEQQNIHQSTQMVTFTWNFNNPFIQEKYPYYLTTEEEHNLKQRFAAFRKYSQWHMIPQELEYRYCKPIPYVECKICPDDKTKLIQVIEEKKFSNNISLHSNKIHCCFCALLDTFCWFGFDDKN